MKDDKELLINALLDAEKETYSEYLSEEEIDWEFSPEFENKMNDLVSGNRFAQDKGNSETTGKRIRLKKPLKILLIAAAVAVVFVSAVTACAQIFDLPIPNPITKIISADNDTAKNDKTKKSQSKKKTKKSAKSHKKDSEKEKYAAGTTILNSQTEADFENFELEYAELDDGTIEITGFTGKITNLVIPETIDTKRVTSIADNAFADYDNLKHITIPDSVKNISGAFTDCSALESVVLGKGIESIGDYTFSFCKSLKSIKIPDSVTSIGDDAFSACVSLKEIEIPASVTSIGENAFWKCRGLKSITIPEGVTKIGDWAFKDCIGLTSVKLPSTLTSIGEYTLSSCTALKSIEVSTKNQNFTSSNGVLFDKEKTRLIFFPGGKQLKSYTVPATVEEIADGAFWKCIGTAEIKINENVTRIGSYAFYACTGMKKITVSEKNDQYLSQNGVLFDKKMTTLISYPAGKSDKSYSICDDVTTIDCCAFSYCKNLTRLKIPKSVIYIEKSDIERTFRNSQNLKNVYYSGSKEDWKKISYHDENTNGTSSYAYSKNELKELMNNAKIHYNPK